MLILVSRGSFYTNNFYSNWRKQSTRIKDLKEVKERESVNSKCLTRNKKILVSITVSGDTLLSFAI